MIKCHNTHGKQMLAISDRDRRAAYQSLSCMPGNPETGVLLTKIKRRQLGT